MDTNAPINSNNHMDNERHIMRRIGIILSLLFSLIWISPASALISNPITGYEAYSASCLDINGTPYQYMVDGNSQLWYKNKTTEWGGWYTYGAASFARPFGCAVNHVTQEVDTCSVNPTSGINWEWGFVSGNVVNYNNIIGPPDSYPITSVGCSYISGSQLRIFVTTAEGVIWERIRNNGSWGAWIYYIGAGNPVQEISVCSTVTGETDLWDKETVPVQGGSIEVVYLQRNGGIWAPFGQTDSHQIACVGLDQGAQPNRLDLADFAPPPDDRVFHWWQLGNGWGSGNLTKAGVIPSGLSGTWENYSGGQLDYFATYDSHNYVRFWNANGWNTNCLPTTWCSNDLGDR